MRIAIFGLGAVGGYLAARLAGAGHHVSAVARGSTLEAIKANGLALHSGNDTLRVQLKVSDRPQDLGPQDLVITTAKATAPTALAEGVAPLLGKDTPIIIAQNGIPWWYGYGLSASRPKPPDLSHLDPDGALRRTIAPERIIGAVIQSSNEMIEPGLVLNTTPATNALLIAEANDAATPRVAELRSVLTGAGVGSPVVNDIRQAIWRKLMINMSASVLCLITGRRLPIVKEDTYIGDFFEAVAHDGIAIATAHGVDVSNFNPAQFRLAPQNHMPSIRQDYDRGRPMEIDAIVLAPRLFGRVAGLKTPSLDAIAAIARRMAIERGLYKG